MLGEIRVVALKLQPLWIKGYTHVTGNNAFNGHGVLITGVYYIEENRKVQTQIINAGTVVTGIYWG